MNRILLFAFFVFSFIGLEAQNYIPFPTSNAIWRESSGNPHSSCDEYNYHITGDTIINSLTYHKLQMIGYHGPYQPSFCLQVSYRYNFYFGAFRNDSLNKRVYFIPSIDTTEHLLYDFDISLGDTLRGWYGNYFLDSNLVVINRDSFLLNGTYRKFYTLKDCGNSILDSVVVIEGIGSNRGLIPFYNCDPHLGPQILHCVKENGITTYSDPFLSCNIITSVEEAYSDSYINIYPNPSSDLIHIESEETIKEVSLYNLQGQEIPIILKRDQSIQLPELPGLYLLKIQMQGGETLIRKQIRN